MTASLASQRPISTAPIATVSSPAVFLHLAIFLDDANNTIIGDETFRLASFSGSDSVSQPFEYQLELHANDEWTSGWQMSDGTCEAIDDSIDIESESNRVLGTSNWQFDELLGCRITFGVNVPAVTRTDANSTVDMSTELEVSNHRFREAVGNSGGGQSSTSDEVPDDTGLSFFNGIVASMSMSGPGIYHITVRPALWQLTLSNRYEIYPQCSIKAALSKLLEYHGVAADFDALDASATKRVQDWLQAGESDYQFLQRLLGKAHIFYYFRHTATSHVVVFCNQAAYPDSVAPGRAFRYVYLDTSELGLDQWDTITDLRYEQSLATAGIDAHFVRAYEAWQGDKLMCQDPPWVFNQASAGTVQGSARVFDLHKVFQYGCTQEFATDFAKKTYLASNASARHLSGQAHFAGFRTGYQFRVSAHTWAYGDMVPVRPPLDQRTFVLTKVEHQASMDGSYKNSFEATENQWLISQFSMDETQQGSVLAVVVDNEGGAQSDGCNYLYRHDFAPESGDYSIDNGGSVVSPNADTPRGVYVVLAVDWPGGNSMFVKLGAYMQSVPNIGSLVLVSRASDETELPELQQIVHSVGSKTVTPSGWTANTSVGSSHSTRYGDGLNVSFDLTSVPDLKKAVAIVTTAYGSELPKKPSSALEGSSPSSTVSVKPPGASVSTAPASVVATKSGASQSTAGAATSSLFGNASYNQGASYGFSTAEAWAKSCEQDIDQTFGSHAALATDLLSLNESYGSSFSRSVGNVQSNISNIGVSYSNSTIGSSENISTITGNSTNTNTVDGTETSTTTHNGDVTSTTTINANSTNTMTTTGNNTNTNTVDGTDTSTTTHNGDVSNTTTINANSTNTTKTTGTSTNINTTGMNNNVNTTGMNNNLSTTGMNNSLDTTGMNTTVNMVGVSNSVNMTGVANNMDVLGVRNSLNVSGMTNSIDFLGNSNSIRSTDLTTDISTLGAGLTVSLSGLVLKSETVLLSIEMPVTLKMVM